MFRLALVFLVACGGAQTRRIPADPPTPIADPGAPVQPMVATPAVATAAPTLEEARVIAYSKAWFQAFDADEAALVVEAMGPAFVMFEDQRFFDRALIEKRFEMRRAKKAPIVTREWSDEHAFSAPGTAVFVARAIETLPGKPPVDGYNTLVWVHDGGRWVIAHMQWVRGGVTAERDRWNEAFAQGIGFNLKPNQLLVDTLKGKKPGTAIDLLMGQGRNALHLASQGWKTTGVDISDEGIRQAKAEAAKQKLKLEALLADVDNYDLGKSKWDLITLIYAGTDASLVGRIKLALKKNGLFICEYFHADSEVAKTGAGGWKTGELAELFKDGFEIVRDEVVDDNADWAGMRKTKLVRFVARKM
jgi:SAM-dependent methyltransferase